MTHPIPHPPPLPFLGNLLDLMDPESPLNALENLADTYGPIYKLMKGKTNMLVVSSVAMVAELCDESRFVKAPPMALSKKKPEEKEGEGSSKGKEKGNGRPAGMFTATNEDPDWGQAHRILVPAFGPLAIEGMFDQMQDIATQLLLKWARLGPSSQIAVTDDFTRLTLDTIALCAMDYRFNSFYSDSMHPFVDAMVGFLSESGNRAKRPAIVTSLMKRKEKQLKSNQDFMFLVGEDLVKQRREKGSGKGNTDLLGAMIEGRDPKTGLGMRDDLIVANIITFLIAGHETTSGLLSFAFLNLLKNPDAYQAVQQEVDNILGRNAISLSRLSKLPYLNAVLRETLRLTPTAPAIQKQLAPNCTGANATLEDGKFKIEPDDKIFILIGAMQCDPLVYGEDAKEFKPERMLEENFKKLPDAAWKPFGNGMRGCIGRAFAWQEALMVMAMLLQNFDFRLHDPAYKLRIKQTLTIKPKDLVMRASLRHGMSAMDLEHFLRDQRPRLQRAPQKGEMDVKSRKPMLVLYGSNTGTCAAFAQRLAASAVGRGFDATAKELDAVANSQLPKGEPVIIITSSYEGNPPDNAARFVKWLSGLGEDALKGVEFAVFGCGHRKSFHSDAPQKMFSKRLMKLDDWHLTYQRIPTLIQTTMEVCGATPLAPRGITDVATGNMSSDFEDWLMTSLWPSLGSSPSPSAAPSIAEQEMEISTQPGISSLRTDVQEGTVTKARALTAPGEPPKRHLEIQLPEGSTYECGDYLAVLPLNSDENVKSVMGRFGLGSDATMVIKGQKCGVLPLNTALSVRDILMSHMELFEVASKKVRIPFSLPIHFAQLTKCVR
ncbi:hypothetical protein G7Y89_g12486 [Cudoniella acicularis]|uniref:Flavodoxin-like domain-containing protein n=1 Tax=Cudoniella acicularis TaxID=354080 RepID=A0A8H4RBF6_9HELO|nr:hypothetical protein G7Y89_g12486 [Cudoniella acicularis]